MISYELLKQRLVVMEESRQQPIDQDSFTKSLNESKDLCEAHDDYTKQGGIFEEFPFYGYGPPTLYPMPRTYAASSIDSDQIGFEGSIEPAIRDTVLRLKSVKKPDESVVYNQMKKEAIIIKREELPTYVESGYMVVYEETSVAPTPTGGQFTDTDGSFDTVAGFDKLLFGKNRKELKKYKGKVFKIPSSMFRRMKEGRERYSRWSDYIEEDGDSDHITAIKNYSLRNTTSPVVVQDAETGERAILRRRYNDSRLKHNRSK